MRISAITESREQLIEQRVRSHWSLCESVTHDMTPEQRRVVENIVLSAIPLHSLIPVLEAELSANQINQLFGNVEKTATDAGGNRTMLGKGKDVVNKANEIINSIGRKIQDTAPVKGFDAKFEKLKKQVVDKLGGEDSKIVSMTQKLGDYAKENPGKTAVVIGLLTALGGIAGGPVGGAIAGKVLRSGLELVKGEKLSTVVGKGMKQAAAGAAMGYAADKVKDFFGGDEVSAAADAAGGAKPSDLDVRKAALELRKAEMEFGVGSPEAIEAAEKARELRQAASGVGKAAAAEVEKAADAAVKDAVEFGDAGIEGANTVSAKIDSNDIVDAAGDNVDTDTVASALSDMTQDEFKANYAKQILQRQLEQAQEAGYAVAGDTVNNDLVLQKIQDSIKFSGNYPDNFSVSYNGNFVRGGIFLSDSEMSQLEQYVGDEFGGSTSDKATEWLAKKGYLADAEGNFASDAADTGSKVKIRSFGTFDPETGEDLPTSAADAASDGKPAGFADMAPDDQAGELLYIDAKNWTPEDLATMQSTGNLTDGHLTSYFSAHPEELAKKLGGNLNKLDDLLNGEYKDVYDNLPSTDREQLSGYLEQMAKKGGADWSGASESVTLSGKKLSEGQIYLLFKRLETVNNQWLNEGIIFESVFDAVRKQQLDEGPLDAIKKGIGAVSGAAGSLAQKGIGKLAQAGKNLTTKVTADKLKSAWTKAGSPTDSNAVADILAKAGVNAEVVNSVYKDMGIEAPAKTAAPEKPAGATNDTTATTPADAAADDAGQKTPADAAGTNTNAATGNAAQAGQTTPTAAVSSKPGAIDIKALADEIINAGPEVIAAVKQMLGVRPQGGGKVPGKLSQTPGAIAKRKKRAAAKAKAASQEQPAAAPANPAVKKLKPKIKLKTQPAATA